MSKVHLAVTRPNDYGGYEASTLCGRESLGGEEINSEPNPSEVTCKLCQKIMADPKHWRYRKWLNK